MDFAPFTRHDRHDGRVDMRGRLIHVQNSRHDIFFAVGFSEPFEIIGTPFFDSALGGDTFHILVRSGQHDADGADLVRSNLAGQPGVFKSMDDSLCPVCYPGRELDQFFVQAGKRRDGVRRHLRPLDVGSHPHFVARCFI